MTATTTTADTEIRALLAERERAMRARDAEALGALFTDDLVSFSLAPPLSSQGRDVQGLRDAGLASYKAAQTKDMDKMLDAADTLTNACSECHDVYREKTEQRGGDAARCTAQ